MGHGIIRKIRRDLQNTKIMTTANKKASTTAGTTSVAGYVVSNLIAIAFTVLVIQVAKNSDSTSDLLAAYGVYHQHPVNQLIHFFGVPAIIWSAFLFFAHVHLPFCASSNVISFLPCAPAHSPNWATVLALVYAVLNLVLDQFGGTIYCSVLYVGYTWAVSIAVADQRRCVANDAPWYGTGRSMRLALGVHLFAWYIQIHPGHAVFEGCQPALVESLGMAVTAAPLFAFYEGLWFVGINRDLQRQTLVSVDERTRLKCEQGDPMRICDQRITAVRA